MLRGLLDNPEHRGRRKNLVLFGVAESPDPTKEDCMKIFSEFMHHHISTAIKT